MASGLHHSFNYRDTAKSRYHDISRGLDPTEPSQRQNRKAGTHHLSTCSLVSNPVTREQPKIHVSPYRDFTIIRKSMHESAPTANVLKCAGLQKPPQVIQNSPDSSKEDAKLTMDLPSGGQGSVVGAGTIISRFRPGRQSSCYRVWIYGMWLIVLWKKYD